jgi:hypothetical protein
MKFKLATAAAAVLMSATASQAADLAKKAPVAVDYVKVCDAYGAGFFYIPGTDTCLRIGGYVRAEAFGGSADFSGDLAETATVAGPGAATNDRNDNSYITRSRLNLFADARSNTEFGLLRSFGAINASFNSTSGHVFELDKAFIQWGGLTAGLAASYWDLFTGYTLQRYFSADEYDDSRTLLAYTFGLGNGLDASISLEDAAQRTSYNGLSLYGGNDVPDIIARLRLTQAWGSAQVMGAAHYLHGNTAAIGDDWGYAFGAGVTINLPMLGAGDAIALQAAYGDGALAYVSHNLKSANATRNVGLIGNVALTGANGLIADFNAAGDTSSGWSIYGGFRHVFSPTVMLNLDASYADIDQAAGLVDFTTTFAAASVTWAPGGNVTGTPGLAISAAVEYRSTDYDTPVTGSYKVDDKFDALVFGARIQRNF